MARAKVISMVEGRPDWYLVEDDLGVSHKVQSGIKGYEYKTGVEYRLFTPNGKYKPCSFRLLPYKTSRRWTDVSLLAKANPATAVGYYFYSDKMLKSESQDLSKVVSGVKKGRLSFVGGGCASINDSVDYQIGDCVAVIHDKIDPLDPDCLLSGNAEPWVAGFGCSQSPRRCSSRYEFWRNYLTPSADLSGDGKFTFKKTAPEKNEIDSWNSKTAGVYINEGMSYGIPATVWAGDALRMRSLPLQANGISSVEEDALRLIYPAPMLERKYDADPLIVSPPVVTEKSISRPLLCGEKELFMSVNLLTQFDYEAGLGYDSKLQLPACMVLIFNKSPWPDYLDGSRINSSLYSYPNGSDKYGTVFENNLDRNFKLVYTAPGTQDFSYARGAYPGVSRDKQHALFRPTPIRTAEGSYLNSPPPSGRLWYNVPMDDDLVSFGKAGELHYRCFNYDGADITPANPAPWSYGLHPGYFEIGMQTSVTRNIYRDFLAAFPFMANPDINLEGNFPSLSLVTFYLQGNVAKPSGEFDPYYPNPAKLECQRIEFFYGE